MTVIFDPGQGPVEGPFAAPSALETIEIAGGIFREAAEDLDRLRRSLCAGNVDELKEAARLARDLRAATQLMLEERNKVDKLRKDIAGGLGATALDLDQARDEIGRRLACLRRAGGG